MKTIILPVALVLLTSCVSAQNVRLRVVDDTGAPVEGAKAIISYTLGSTSDDHVGPTDREGIFSAQGKALIGIYLATSKDGHYPARFEGYLPKKDVDQLVVLPRVLNPTALYANRFDPGSGKGLILPVQNEWLGYDFQMGDWVQPRGKGKTADILFRFKSTFNGWRVSDKDMENNRRINSDATEEEIRIAYGKWDATLEISFPGAKEGIHEEKERFLSYSALKLPHAAPADGYVATWRYTANTCTTSTARDNVGFFLRTRVKLDDKGAIVSANYAKLIGDIYFSPATGTLQFFYYFNPTPNDRNLEFDTKRNLFPAKFPGANVGDP